MAELYVEHNIINFRSLSVSNISFYNKQHLENLTCKNDLFWIIFFESLKTCKVNLETIKTY